ncbi:hypothetical protein DPMN_152552 [Dreissena polymorpha]|uniref:Uncharacterized protein n=1 Tax=Dreissena polymorpha TaxID=45954 RepID=A0A9D4J814_DREPO|nr:hypothetical protein DPMN_152552 [Dreissena polymorpha]
MKENTAIVNTSCALWPIEDLNVPRKMKTLGLSTNVQTTTKTTTTMTTTETTIDDES